MSIDPDDPVFPNNVVALVATRADLLDADLRVFKRPLRASDPNESFGIFAAQWEPQADSFEIKGVPTPGPNEPTLQTYLITIQAFVKDFQEDRGLAKHSVLAKYVRSMLYHDVPLRIGLSTLSVTTGGNVEKATRWGIRTQRFLSNEVDGNFLYLSTFEFWLETETT